MPVKRIPPFFRQQGQYTCSLAVLRMVLAYFGKVVTEEKLIKQVEALYGKDFHNLWNPTIVKLARGYGLATQFYAAWPLLKSQVFSQAWRTYQNDPRHFSPQDYEAGNDDENLEEPLALAYQEMFAAVALGCQVHYGRLTAKRLLRFLSQGYLLQSSVHLEKLYPGKTTAFHSLLVYHLENDKVFYHDPALGEQLHCSFSHFLQAATDTGAFMLYGPGDLTASS